MSTLPGSHAAPDWPRWIRGLGRQVLRLREVLGLSQERLAALSGVSQGAVSRLENGRGLATPLLVVMKVSEALTDSMSEIDAELLSPEARQMLNSQARRPGPENRPPVTPPDAALAELVRLYHRLPEPQREQLLTVVRATAAALRQEPAGSRQNSER